MPNIFGHKDISATACPGANLYEKLPIIRSVAKSQKTEKWVDYEDKSELYYIELKPDETKEITVKMKNITKETWNSKTFIVVDRDPRFEGVMSFPGIKRPVLAKMKEKSVKPGKTATFEFKIKGHKKGDIVYMNIAPLVNGYDKSRQYIVVPVAVQQTDFKYELLDSKFPGDTMEKGEKFKAWVKLKNTGNVTWRKSGENTVFLGTDHERDRLSTFASPNSTRIGSLKEDEVAPGKTGTFLMNLQAPESVGYYKEYFTPVVEGITWMSDTGMYFATTVFGDQYAGEVTKVTAIKNWERGRKYSITMVLRNLGKKTWTKKNMKLVFMKESDLKIKNAKLLTSSVASGKLGTISFEAEVSKLEELERKPVLIRPKVNGEHILDKPMSASSNCC